MPRGLMRPASASAMTSANISSIARAGRTSTRSRASSAPALANEWATPGLDEEHVARAGDDRAQPDPEAHLAGDDLEALALVGVHVRHRNRAAGPEREVEREQLALGARRGRGEGEALAGDRVLDGLAGLGRAGSDR